MVVPYYTTPLKGHAMTQVSVSDDLLTVNEVAEKLKISPHTVRYWVQERKVPFMKIGKRLRFDPQELAQWLETKRVNPDE